MKLCISRLLMVIAVLFSIAGIGAKPYMVSVTNQSEESICGQFKTKSCGSWWNWAPKGKEYKTRPLPTLAPQETAYVQLDDDCSWEFSVGKNGSCSNITHKTVTEDHINIVYSNSRILFER